MKLFFLFILPTIFLGVCEANSNCAAGWTQYADGCYLYTQEPQDFISAMMACELAGAQLVEVDSATENSFVMNMAINANASLVWIGLEDFFTDGDYVWSHSRKRPVYQNWQSGQPDSGHHSQDCVAMHAPANGTWADFRCHLKYPSVCEKRIIFDNAIG